MSKLEIQYVSWVVKIFLVIVGIWLLLKGTDLGINTAEYYIAKRGGMDTASFLIVKEGYISSYRLLGGILFFFGCYSVLRKVKLLSN